MAIEFARFLQRTYSYRKKEKNQGVFVVKCFLSAGSHHFKMPEKYMQKSTELEAARMLMKVDTSHRKLTAEMKKSFPIPLESGLADYLAEGVDEEQLREALTELRITISTEANAEIYGKALSDQFQLFVESDDYQVEDIVAKRYMERLQDIAHDDYPDAVSGKYIGDRIGVFKTAAGFRYEINSEGSFTHKWMIRNSGKVVWHDRKLKMINQGKIRPRAEQDEIVIPETQPGEIVELQVVIDARGFEGTYECQWAMIDEDGVDCFPDETGLNITVISTFEI